MAILGVAVLQFLTLDQSNNYDRRSAVDTPNAMKSPPQQAADAQGREQPDAPPDKPQPSASPTTATPLSPLAQAPAEGCGAEGGGAAKSGNLSPEPAGAAARSLSVEAFFAQHGVKGDVAAAVAKYLDQEFEAETAADLAYFDAEDVEKVFAAVAGVLGIKKVSQEIGRAHV